MICIHDGADLDYVTAPIGSKIPIDSGMTNIL